MYVETTFEEIQYPGWNAIVVMRGVGWGVGKGGLA